jgi:ABC-type multidrug transport system ATPase subunit
MNQHQVPHLTTSLIIGLDAQSAFNIVRFLRKLCDAGQAILCTIHQPSAILFEHFDDLLLLQAGGKTVYFGELGDDSQTLIKYLEANGAPKCKKNANPAEYPSISALLTLDICSMQLAPEQRPRRSKTGPKCGWIQMNVNKSPRKSRKSARNEEVQRFQSS